MSEYKDITVATLKTYRVRADSYCGIDPKYMVEYRQFDHDCPAPLKVEHILYSARPVETSDSLTRKEKS